MPFGLSNTAKTFQRMMDCTTDSLKGVFAYMDDSRMGSPDRQTHLHHLEAFFNALATNGLAINLEKCVFAVPSLEILGHTVLVCLHCQRSKIHHHTCPATTAHPHSPAAVCSSLY
jgi:hypothetical protein